MRALISGDSLLPRLLQYRSEFEGLSYNHQTPYIEKINVNYYLTWAVLNHNLISLLLPDVTVLTPISNITLNIGR